MKKCYSLKNQIDILIRIGYFTRYAHDEKWRGKNQAIEQNKSRVIEQQPQQENFLSIIIVMHRMDNMMGVLGAYDGGVSGMPLKHVRH